MDDLFGMVVELIFGIKVKSNSKYENGSFFEIEALKCIELYVPYETYFFLNLLKCTTSCMYDVLVHEMKETFNVDCVINCSLISIQLN